jgi:hypothetical protein
MRRLALHARGRQVGPIACGLLGIAIACWALALLTDETGMLVPILGPLTAVSLLGFALGAADPALERTMPQRWARWRAAELGVCAIAAGVALLPTLLQADEHMTAALRNLAGLGGLTALGVVWLGVRLAWLAPTTWTFSGLAIGPRCEDWLAALTWPVQPDDTGFALVVAAALALTGAFVHTRHGAATTIASAE